MYIAWNIYLNITYICSGKNRQLREKDGEIRALLKENDVLHNEYDDMLQEIKSMFCVTSIMRNVLQETCMNNSLYFTAMSVDLAKKSNALSHLTLENLNLVEELENNEQLLQNTQSNIDLLHILFNIFCNSYIVFSVFSLYKR